MSCDTKKGREDVTPGPSIQTALELKGHTWWTGFTLGDFKEEATANRPEMSSAQVTYIISHQRAVLGWLCLFPQRCRNRPLSIRQEGRLCRQGEAGEAKLPGPKLFVALPGVA